MKSFHLSILTPFEIYTAILRIYNLLKDRIITDVFILKVLPKLKKALDDLKAAIGRSTDPEMVKLLIEKDLIRDTKYIAFRDYCALSTLDPDPAIASAGRTIVNIIREIGWSMHLMGFAKQTSTMDALINRMETAPANAALITIQGSERFTAMKTAFTDFENIHKSKVDTKSMEVFPKIKDSRIAVQRYTAALLSYTDINSELDGGVFTEVSVRIDEIITEFESMAHNRQTQNENSASLPKT